MGLFQKLKDFGSKVVKKLRTGVDFVRDRVVPIVKRVWNTARPVVDAVVPGAKPITQTIENTASKVGGLFGIK